MTGATITTWMSLKQITELLAKGELSVGSQDGEIVKLHIHFIDRVTAAQLPDSPMKEETYKAERDLAEFRINNVLRYLWGSQPRGMEMGNE